MTSLVQMNRRREMIYNEMFYTVKYRDCRVTVSLPWVSDKD